MRLRIAMATVALVVGSAAAAHAGPPWISIEYPSNPHHATTRNAALLIHAYHHTAGISTQMEGVATGIVDGRRMTMRLDVRETALPGVYALRTALPTAGTWVLAFTMRDGTAAASALVTVDRQGSIGKVTVPSSTSKDGWVIPRAATQHDIDTALRAGALANNGSSRAGNAALGIPVGLVLLMAAVRRRRGSHGL